MKSDAYNFVEMTDETPQEAAAAIISGLEYLAREALMAGLPDASRALVALIMHPTVWETRHQ